MCRFCPGVMSLKSQFGQRVRFLRRAADLSQDELAEACGCSVETISFIERGIHGPRFDLLERLAAALGRPVADLFRFDSVL